MKPYRIAKPGEFTFKRDSAGVETVEHSSLIFATMNGPTRATYLDLLRSGHPSMDSVASAISAAKRAGFWTMGTHAAMMSPVSVTVQVGP